MISNITEATEHPANMSTAIIKLKKKMLLHFFREETFVFPSSELFGPHALVLGLLTEHAGMLRMVDKILFYIEDGDLERASDRLAGLHRLLVVHCDREEREVYKKLEESGTIHEIAAMAANKRLPNGWKPLIAARYDRKS
jgi:hemerythrin